MPNGEKIESERLPGIPTLEEIEAAPISERLPGMPTLEEIEATQKKKPTPSPALAGELPSEEFETITKEVYPLEPVEEAVAEEPARIAEPAPITPTVVPEFIPEAPTEVPTGLPIGETPLQEQREFLLQRTAEAGKTDADRIKELLEKGEPTGELTFMDKIGEIETAQLIPFVSGVNEAAQISELLQAANRLDDDTASDKDVLLLLEFINKGKEETSFWYDVMNVVAELPAFAGELLITGGIYTASRKLGVKGGTTLLKKLLREGGEKLVKKKAAKIATAVAGGIAGATVQTVPAGITRIWAKTLENTMPEFEFTVDEGNQITGSITKPGDNVYLAAVKALGDQWIETLSERSGGLFRTAGRAGKEVMLRHGLLRGFLKANPKAKTSDFMNIVRRAGYDGVIAEMGEERLGEIGRATLGLDEWKLPTPRQLAVELVSFSIPGLAISVANTATTKGKVKYETGEAEKEIEAALPTEVAPEAIGRAPEAPKVPVEGKPAGEAKPPKVVPKGEVVEEKEAAPPEEIPKEAPPKEEVPEGVEQPITETTFKAELKEEFIEEELPTVEKPIRTTIETPGRTLTYDYYTETTPEGEVKYLKKITDIKEKVIPERIPPEKVPEEIPPPAPPVVPKVPAKLLEIAFPKEARIEEVTKQTEAKLEPSTREARANLSDINIDVDRFQNREEEYSQETVDSIVKDVREGKFIEGALDPIRIWKDPKDNKFYVLAGHSRLKAYQILSEEGKTEFNNIPSIQLEGLTLEQAKKFATEKSNILGRREAFTERANIYRKMKEEGASEAEIARKAKGNEKDNWVFVTNLSNLNPAGKAIAAVKSFARSTDIEGRQKMEAIADWTGEIKRRFKDLSNLHEDEIYDFLIDAYSRTKQASKVSNKQDFILLAENVIDGAKRREEFAPDRLLNFKNYIGRSPYQLEYDNQLAEAKKKVNDFRKESDDKRADLILKKATPSEMDRILKPFEDKLRRAIKDLNELRKQKGLVKDITKRQTSIFDELEELKQKKEVQDDTISRIVGQELASEEIKQGESTVTSIEDKAEVAGKAEEIEASISEIDDAITKPITVKLEAPELTTLLEQAERGADIRSEFREALGRHLKIIEPAKQEATKKLWEGRLKGALEKGEVKIAEVEKEIVAPEVIPPEVPPQIPEEKIPPGEMVQRGFQKRSLEVAVKTPAQKQVKAVVEENRDYYEQMNVNNSVNDATKEISDAGGFDVIYEDLKKESKLSEIPSRQIKRQLGMDHYGKLMDEAVKAKDEVKSKVYYDKINSLQEIASREATTAGQSSAMLMWWKFNRPDGTVDMMKRKIKNYNEEQLKTKKVKKLQEKINKETDERKRKRLETDLQKLLAKELTPEQASKLKQLAENVQKYKGKGLLEREAVTEMIRYMDSLFPTSNRFDTFVSLYYSSILSGASTHVLNMWSAGSNIVSLPIRNVTNLSLWYRAIKEGFKTGEWETFKAYNPMNEILYMPAAFAQGVSKGGTAFKNVWSEGGMDNKFMERVGDNKYAKISPLERQTYGKNAFKRFRIAGIDVNPYNYYKYVGRALAAEDALMFNTVYDMQLSSLLHEKHVGEGLRGKQLKKAVFDDLLARNVDKEAVIKEIDKEVEEFEKDTGIKINKTKKKILLRERIQDRLDKELKVEAEELARDTIFTGDRGGLIANTARAIANVANKNYATAIAIKPFVPFTRVVGNVAEFMLDATPVYGIARAHGISFTGLIKRTGVDIRTAQLGDVGTRKYYEQMGRAWFGTTAALVSAALFVGTDEDDFLEISGGYAPEGFRKRGRENVMPKYSIRIGNIIIPYMNIPILAIPLAMIGNYNDRLKLGDKEETLYDRLTATGLLSLNIIIEMSFMEGVQRLLQFMSDALKETEETSKVKIRKEEDIEKRVYRMMNESKTFKGLFRTYFGVVTKIAPQNFNLIQQGQKLFDPTSYSQKDISDMLKYNIGILRTELNLPNIDALGEPIKTYPGETLLPYTHWLGLKGKDERWKFLAKYNAIPTGIYNRQMYIDEEYRRLTPEELYKYTKLAGQNFNKKLLKYMDNTSEVIEREKEEIEIRGKKITGVQQDIKDLWTEAKKEAKDKLGLTKVREGGMVTF